MLSIGWQTQVRNTLRRLWFNRPAEAKLNKISEYVQNPAGTIHILLNNAKSHLEETLNQDQVYPSWSASEINSAKLCLEVFGCGFGGFLWFCFFFLAWGWTGKPSKQA